MWQMIIVVKGIDRVGMMLDNTSEGTLLYLYHCPSFIVKQKNKITLLMLLLTSNCLLCYQWIDSNYLMNIDSVDQIVTIDLAASPLKSIHLNSLAREVNWRLEDPSRMYTRNPLFIVDITIKVPML